MKKFYKRTSALIALPLLVLAVSPTISYNSKSLATVEAPRTLASQKPEAGIIVVDIVAKEDNRVARLEKYFKSKNSPFVGKAQNFIDVADKYNIDWTLLPAIAFLESQLGLRIPAGSYNPYGWNNGKFTFASFEQANEVVGKALRTRYAPTGEITPWRIGKMYAASPTWASRVAKYQAEIRNF